MNLYNVMDKNYEWSCFVFAPTRNKAKKLVADHFFIDYIDLRSRCLKKGVNIDHCVVVDHPDDEYYDLVVNCGFSYDYDEL